MRADRLIPGNPWPHEMILTIVNDSDALLDLLWVRQALDLHPHGDDWPPLPSSPATETPTLTEPTGTEPTRTEMVAPTREELSEAWGRIWTAAVLHAGNPPGHDLLVEARTTTDQVRRSEILNSFRGPSWRDAKHDADLGDAYTQWRDSVVRSLIDERSVPLEQTPERRSLPALIDAWRRGLLTIVEIPTPGTYTRTLSPHGLPVAAETRADPRRFTEALHAFRPETE